MITSSFSTVPASNSVTISAPYSLTGSTGGTIDGASLLLTKVSSLSSGNETFLDTTSTNNIFNVGDTITTTLSSSAGVYIGYITVAGTSYPVFKGTIANFVAPGTNVTGTYALHVGPLACFAAGTLIRTISGDRAIETLGRGDVVLTAFGERRTIEWVGHRTLAGAEMERPAIRIRAHCFGDDLPARDLVLSPEHALYLDGVLVPAMHLVDGDAIAEVALESITYFHVMLATHDVLLAEGLPAESFLDDGDFSRFENGDTAGTMGAMMVPCAPRVTQGERLELVRRRIRVFA